MQIRPRFEKGKKGRKGERERERGTAQGLAAKRYTYNIHAKVGIQRGVSQKKKKKNMDVFPTFLLIDYIPQQEISVYMPASPQARLFVAGFDANIQI